MGLGDETEMISDLRQEDQVAYDIDGGAAIVTLISLVAVAERSLLIDARRSFVNGTSRRQGNHLQQQQSTNESIT